MAGNVQPIFSKVGKIGLVDNILLADTSRDATGANVKLLLTADATNGSRVDKVVIQPRGTNVASVMRIWINNGGAVGTGTNNVLFREISLPATTATEVAALAAVESILDLVLPPAYRLYIAIGTAVAAGFGVSAWGGDY